MSGNARRFEVLMYLSVAAASMPWLFPSLYRLPPQTPTYTAFAIGWWVFIIWLIWLTARRSKNWARWTLFALFVLQCGQVAYYGYYWGTIGPFFGHLLLVTVLNAWSYYYIFTGDGAAQFRRKTPPPESVFD